MLLKDINVKGGKLESKINNINEKLEIIESGMHKVRLAGNKAVHESDIEFTDNEIIDMAENVESFRYICTFRETSIKRLYDKNSQKVTGFFSFFEIR